MIEFNDNGKRREVMNRGSRSTKSLDIVQPNFRFVLNIFKEVVGQSSSDSTSASEIYIELTAEDGSRIRYKMVGDSVSMEVMHVGSSTKQLNAEFNDLKIPNTFWQELQSGSVEKAAELLSDHLSSSNLADS